jgi:hypothetical protein
MTPHRILLLNGISTAACAIGMLLTRGMLFREFGLQTPRLLDAVAVGLLAYAVALVVAARRDTVERPIMLAFTAADAAWVAGSAILLTICWAELTPLARFLVIAVALAVDLFAMLQFRAAGTLTHSSARLQSTS